MFTSIDDVTPIDSNEVGNRVADFLQTAGQIALITTAALFVLGLIIGIVVAKKAGYSGWWGALAVLVPPLGVILALLFAFLKWPALKERDEAIGVIDANDLMLPSRERAAVKEAERRKQLEEDARRRMEQARIDREKAEAESARYRRAQAADEAAAATAAAAPAKSDAAPAATPAPPAPPAPDAATKSSPQDKPSAKADAKPANAPNAGTEAKPAQESQSAKEAESEQKSSASKPSDKKSPTKEG